MTLEPIPRDVPAPQPISFPDPADRGLDCLGDRVQALPKRASIDELWRFAAIDGVQTVVRPCLEARA